jgi:hypothetical protein
LIPHLNLFSGAIQKNYYRYPPLYRLKTMMGAASIKLPFPARKAKDRIEAKLYAVMELAAEEIARNIRRRFLRMLRFHSWADLIFWRGSS